MDVPSYLLGKKKGGGGTTSLQNKTVEITENGTTTVSADAGYDGLRNVEIDTNVQPTLQTKSQTITTNTTTTITADNDYDGLSSVEITTNIPQPSGEISITENGSYNVSDYASANVNVSTSSEDDDSDLINFYDYDGTLVDSVRLSELPLSELPTPPAHEGLTFEKWNWTLADVNALTYPMDVGALYTTTSGATEFYFENIEYCVLNIQAVSPTTSDDIYVDWGDGTVETYSTNYTHDYAIRGDYVVKVYTLSGTGKYRLFGQKSSSVYKTCITNNSTDKYAENLYHLKELHIGQECIRANNYSLYGCGYLQKISVHSQFEIYTNVSNSNTEVSVFNNCNMLKYIVLSPVQQYLGGNMFYNCYCLKGISFAKQFLWVYSNIFSNNYCIKRICVSENCKALTNVAGANYLKSIYTSSNNTLYFYTYTLTGNTIYSYPSKYNGKIIFGSDFYPTLGVGYGSLKYNQNVEKLSDYNIGISDQTTIVGAASYCYSLVDASNFDDLCPSATQMYNMFQYDYSLETASIPSTITSFGSNGNNFRSCYYLKSITLPSNLATVGTYDFDSCRSLSSVTIPSSLTNIGNYMFEYCYNLKELTFSGSGTTTLGMWCFANCYGLKEVTLPSSLTSILTGAFGNCYGIKKYDFTNLTAVPSLASTNAITINTNTKIVVPDDLYESWIAANNWSTFASSIVKESEYTA